MLKLSTFQMRHAALTRTFVKTLDKAGMLRLSRRLRGTFAARRALGAALFICLLAMNQSAAFSNNKPTIMDLKFYAYNKLTWKQMECYNYLLHVESRWNYKARNGSHYGLGQMRSKWYGTLNPFKQIDAHLDYIKHRYRGDTCKALRHWERKGWH